MTVQSSFGPVLGQVGVNDLSVVVPSPFGPRKRGQSAAFAPALADISINTATVRTALLRDAGVLERANAFDFDFAHVPRLEQHGRGLARNAHAGRGAREDQVARLEGDDLRDEREQVRHAEDEFLRARILHRLAVQAELDAEVVRVEAFVRRHDHGPGRGEGVERLADGPLFFFAAELPVPGTHVVAAGVAADVIEGRFVVRDVLARFPDDDHQLGLVVHLLGDLRQLDRFTLGDERIGVLREQDRLGRDRLATFDGVVAIVQADANDFGRPGHGRQELDRNAGIRHGLRARGGLGGGLFYGRGGGE